MYQLELMFRRWDALALEASTVVCGCGGGDALPAVLPAVLRRAPRLVLGADARGAIAADAALAGLLAERAGRGQVTVLTPHPLEAARLLMTDARTVQADRLAAARALVERWGVIVALKGSGTIIAAPNQTPRLNPTGNARLATAGTGDVLAGLIGAYLAAGREPLHNPARVGAPGFGMGCKAQSAAIPGGIASICNAADRPKPGCAGRDRVMQRLPSAFAAPFDAVCAAVYRHGQIAELWCGPEPLTAGVLARQAGP
jgi:NAD(P)H-hydrate repair Nnr-like enzyme with NAD(P)H-hydrate dehydratase domain